jgi:protease-4
MHLIDGIGDFRTAVLETAKAVNISGEPSLVHAERERKSLIDLVFGDVTPWLPTKEKLLDEQIGFYYLWK